MFGLRRHISNRLFNIEDHFVSITHNRLILY
jgi:hypothetical protein